jgi:excisionase family DNA binding protein
MTTAFDLDTLIDALAERVAERAAKKLASRLPSPAGTAVPAAPIARHPDELLTVPEAAAELKVTPATVRGWIASGALKARRLGRDGESRLWRIRRGDLDAVADRRDDGPPADDVDALATRVLGRATKGRR